MAVSDYLFDLSDSTLNARTEVLIKTAVETAVEKINQARTPRPQGSYDLEETGVVKREDRVVLKYEAACNIRTPKVEAQGESKLAIPEFNDQSLTGNAETTEQGRQSTKTGLKGSEHTTPLTAKREALPLCSTVTAVSPGGPSTIYSSGEGRGRNIDQGHSDSSAYAESSLTKRKADAMQKICQPYQGQTAASRSGRRIRGLKERPDVQDLPKTPTWSPDQEVMPGKPCTTRGLHLYSKRWSDRNLQSVLSEGRSASIYYQYHTQSHNRHDSEEVETDEIEVQPDESSNKRRKIEHMQGLNSDELSDYGNVPHILFVGKSPANIDRRGYPRLIHIEHFTEETNTDNLTMADFVATILFHHSPNTLTAFFDEKRYPKFGFAARNPTKAQDFAIERAQEKWSRGKGTCLLSDDHKRLS